MKIPRLTRSISTVLSIESLQLSHIQNLRRDSYRLEKKFLDPVILMCLSPRVLSVIATISEEEASSQKTNDAQSTSHGKTDFEERMRKRNAIAYMKQKENGKRRKYQDARNLKNRDKMVRSALVEEMHLYPAVMAKVKMLPVRGSKLNGAPLYEFIDEARKDWEKRKSCEIRKGAIDNVANLQDTGTNTSACDA